ncbi:MAG: ATP synthase F1 subunit epsilon [Acidimicrobiales bacterium]
MTLQVELVSPERILYSGEADMVIARTVGGGELAFLTGHTPFVGALDIATVTIRSQAGDEVVAVHGGFVEVSNDRVTILSDVAELGSQVDVERARRAAEEAEARLRQTDDIEAEAATRRAHVRMAAAGGVRGV